MSAIALAEAIDRLVTAGLAFVVEAEDTVTVSNLTARDAGDLMRRSRALEWTINAFDSAEEPWTDDIPSDDFAPFRVIIQKPPSPTDTLKLLTDAAFARWLQRGHTALRWQVAGLNGPVRTQARLLEPWGAAGEVGLAALSKSPRLLVREYGAERRVTEDIRPWLANPIDHALFATPTVQVWARAAAGALLLTLADEIDPLDGKAKFRGPPRLALPALPESWDLVHALGQIPFVALQDAAHWVFENGREAEMRHILLATELARCSALVVDTPEFLREHMASAWESAQISYQMALADTSRDTLKVLTELRKAITEETAKLSDIARQLMAAVASALAVGIGLIAARVAAAAPAMLIAAVMGVVAIYVLLVILSGCQFIGLQRQLRAEWQPKLYRFLPPTEFARMVTIPVTRAERSFYWTSALGGIAVLVLAVVCIWPAMSRPALPVAVQPSLKIRETSSVPATVDHGQQQVHPAPSTAKAASSAAAKDEPKQPLADD